MAPAPRLHRPRDGGRAPPLRGPPHGRPTTPPRARGRATRARLHGGRGHGVLATGLPRHAGRRHRHHGPRPPTAPSTCTSPRKEACSSSWSPRWPSEFGDLTDALPVIRDDEAGPRRAGGVAGVVHRAVPRLRPADPVLDRCRVAAGGQRTRGARPPGHASPRSSPPRCGSAASKRLDPAIAALAVVAMVERVNYFLATDQLARRRGPSGRGPGGDHPRRLLRSRALTPQAARAPAPGWPDATPCARVPTHVRLTDASVSCPRDGSGRCGARSTRTTDRGERHATSHDAVR